MDPRSNLTPDTGVKGDDPVANYSMAEHLTELKAHYASPEPVCEGVVVLPDDSVTVDANESKVQADSVLQSEDVCEVEADVTEAKSDVMEERLVQKINVNL